MLNKTMKVALAAALLAGSAAAAVANDSGETDVGGFVIPGSMDGVNPAYHPDLFPNYPRSTTSTEAGKAYSYVPSVQQKHRVMHLRTQDEK